MAFYDDISNFNSIDILFKDKPVEAFGVFAESYHLSAKKLAEDMLSRRFSVYEPYPMIFLYRHSIELHLKNILFSSAILANYKDIDGLTDRIDKTHNLSFLLDKVRDILFRLFPENIWLKSFLDDKLTPIVKEYMDIDSGSFSFRYPTNSQGQCSTKPNICINVESMYKNLEPILEGLDAIDMGIEIETYQASEICEVLDVY